MFRCKAPEILRVAPRRIRSDIMPRRRVGESARGVLELYATTMKDKGNAADACLPVGRGVFEKPV
jgi:hypothetical protein